MSSTPPPRHSSHVGSDSYPLKPTVHRLGTTLWTFRAYDRPISGTADGRPQRSAGCSPALSTRRSGTQSAALTCGFTGCRQCPPAIRRQLIHTKLVRPSTNTVDPATARRSAGRSPREVVPDEASGRTRRIRRCRRLGGAHPAAEGRACRSLPGFGSRSGQDGALELSGLRLRGLGAGAARRDGRRSRVDPGARPACSPRSPAACRRSRSTSPPTASRVVAHLRIVEVHAADAAARRVPDPAGRCPTVAGTVGSDAFAAAVAPVAIAAGRDDALPVLTGIRVEIDGEQVTLAATDRYRLAVRTLRWAPTRPAMQATALVPARTLADAAKSLTAGAEVTLALSGDRPGRGPDRVRPAAQPVDDQPAARRRVPEVPLAAAGDLVRDRDRRLRRADRGGTPGGARGLADLADPAVVLAGRRQPRGRRRRRGRGAGVAAGRVRRRAADDRVQRDVPARRARLAGLRRGAAVVHRTDEAGGAHRQVRRRRRRRPPLPADAGAARRRSARPTRGRPASVHVSGSIGEGGRSWSSA